MKREILAIGLGMVVLSVVSVSCKKSAPDQPRLPEGVVAQIDGQGITPSDIVARAAKFPPGAWSKLTADQIRHSLLENLIAEKILARLCENAGLDKDPHFKVEKGQTRDEALARLYRLHLVHSLPGPDKVKMDFSRPVPSSALKGSSPTPEQIQYMRIQNEYVNSQIQKARENMKIEIDETQLSAIVLPPSAQSRARAH